MSNSPKIQRSDLAAGQLNSSNEAPSDSFRKKQPVRIGGFALSGKARRADRLAKKSAAQLMHEKLSVAGVKAKGLFATEGKVLGAIGRHLPSAAICGAVGAGIASAVFTHGMWLPQTLHFLQTTPGLITLGVLAAVGIGLAAFYVARKTKLNVGQFIKRHGGDKATEAQAGASQAEAKVPVAPRTPVASAKAPEAAKLPESPTASVAQDEQISSHPVPVTRNSSAELSAEGPANSETYSDAPSNPSSRAPSETFTEMMHKLDQEASKPRPFTLNMVD